MKRRIMIGLKGMIEADEQGAYAVELGSKLKDRGYEVYVFADRIIESRNTLKAHERGVKLSDHLHQGVESLKGEFVAYVALDEWAKDNMPPHLDMKKLLAVNMEKSAEETANSIVTKIKGKSQFKE